MQVSDIEYHAPLSKSDHFVVTFKYHCYLDYSQPKERYVYHKTDFNSMRRRLVFSNWTEKFIIQNQLMNYGIILNLKFMKSEISSFQNN